MAEIVSLNSIDAEQFRVPAKDTKGHSDRVWFRCQPGHASALASVVQSGVFPYRTNSDLLRHALVRHLHYLETLNQQLGGKQMPSVLAATDAMLAILRDDLYYTEFHHVLQTLTTQLNTHKGLGEFGEARRLLLEVLRCWSTMPEGFWKDKYKKQIETDHKDLLAKMPKADLLAFGDEE